MAGLKKLCSKTYYGSLRPKDHEDEERCYEAVGYNQPPPFFFTAYLKNGNTISYAYSQLVAIWHIRDGGEKIIAEFLDSRLGKLEIHGHNLQPIAKALTSHHLESVTECVRVEFEKTTTIDEVINKKGRAPS